MRVHCFRALGFTWGSWLQDPLNFAAGQRTKVLKGMVGSREFATFWSLTANRQCHRFPCASTLCSSGECKPRASAAQHMGVYENRGISIITIPIRHPLIE